MDWYLSKLDQETWDTLPEETKILILDKAAHTTDHEANLATIQFIEAQIRVLSVATEVNKAETILDEASDDDDDESATLLADDVTQRSFPQSDIRRILSTPDIKKKVEKHTHSQAQPKWQQDCRQWKEVHRGWHQYFQD